MNRFLREHKIINLPTLLPYQRELIEFFQNVPFGRYLSDKNFINEKSIIYELSILESYINETGLCFVLKDENDRILGLIGFHFSNWDSEVLKRKTAIIKYYLIREDDNLGAKDASIKLINVFIKWARKNRIEFAIAKVDSNYSIPMLTLQEMDFLFLECSMINTTKVNDIPNDKIVPPRYRHANINDLDCLKDLAKSNTFKKSHFYLDKRLSDEIVDSLYVKWIDSAVKSNKKILVIEIENQIVGMFIYEAIIDNLHFGKRIAKWQSAFVSSEYRGHGLGNALFQAVIHSCKSLDIEIIDSELAEKNIISQKLHEKYGFKLVFTTYTFHKWFKYKLNDI